MTAGAAAGLLAGYAADRLLGDPRRGHPVAGFGALAGWLERRCHRDHRGAGAAYAGVLALAAAAVGHAGVVATRRSAPGRVAWQALTVWAALGGRSLATEAAGVAAALRRGDPAGARRRLPALCARDPATLDATGLCRATVESLAENTSDAVVAPLLWAAAAGPAGAAGYRAVNTLDAMVGYRTTRFLRFGWAAARLDDAANWLPARVTAALACALAPTVGGSPARARSCWRRFARTHPSPNAGPVEAAFAGALDRRLGGGVNRYGDHLDHRPPLGRGPDPSPADVYRAVRLATAVGLAAALLTAGLAALPGAAGSPAGHGRPPRGRR